MSDGENASRADSQTEACRNGLIFELGNGLARTTVVTYLARELGADGIAIGFIVASQHLVGVLRLFAPAILRRFPARKTFAIIAFLISGVLLCALPIVSAPGFLPTPAASLTALVGSWISWHFVMYVGAVALFSWFGDFVPKSFMGRFFGRRESWRMGGAIAGMLLAGLFAAAWTGGYPKHWHWFAYAVPTFAGGIVMLLAVLPLIDIPAPVNLTENDERPERPWTDSRFRSFLAFACWGAFANGVTQAPQAILPSALGLAVLVPLALESGMRVGQAAIAPFMGRMLDRWGARWIMIGSQVITAAALLFFLRATRAEPYWVAGAWVLWIAYVGLNVALPRTMLAVSPNANSPRYIAAYYALTGLAVGLGGVLGGIVFESVGRTFYLDLARFGLTGRLDRFQVFFVCGLVLRLTAVIPLLRWKEREPCAKTTPGELNSTGVVAKP